MPFGFHLNGEVKKTEQAAKPAAANKFLKPRQAVSQVRTTVKPMPAARPAAAVRKPAPVKPISMSRPLRRNVVELTGGASAADELRKLGAERQRSIKRNASQKARK